ncbi:putative Late nodulin [Medicago truncatula]|nr:putative Late nodulin [Medicago truncatula]
MQTMRNMNLVYMFVYAFIIFLSIHFPPRIKCNTEADCPQRFDNIVECLFGICHFYIK